MSFVLRVFIALALSCATSSLLASDLILDARFGVNGVKLIDFQHSAGVSRQIFGVLPEASGGWHLQARGFVAGAEADIFVGQYDESGERAPGFGENGIQRIASVGRDYAGGFARTSDGGILVGVAGFEDPQLILGDARVFKLNADGAFDTGFGAGGELLLGSLTGFSLPILTLPDGSFVVARRAADPYPLLVERFAADGRATGVPYSLAMPDGRPYGNVTSLIGLSDGSLLLAGWARAAREPGGPQTCVVWKIDEAGAVSEFGENGLVSFDLDLQEPVSSCRHAVEFGGSIILSGDVNTEQGLYTVIAKISPLSGELLPDFGNDGRLSVAKVDYQGLPVWDFPASLGVRELSSQAAEVVVLYAIVGSGDDDVWIGLGRFDAQTGSPNTDFGADGIRVFERHEIGARFALPSSMAFNSSGDLAIVGMRGSGAESGALLIKLTTSEIFSNGFE